MIDCVGSLVLKVLAQIYCLIALIQILPSDILHPLWNGGAKQKELWGDLHYIQYLVHDLLNVLLEAHVEHLICFV